MHDKAQALRGVFGEQGRLGLARVRDAFGQCRSYLLEAW